MTKEELLYKYFANELTPAQLEQFNDLLATNADFKAQFDFENNVKQAITNTKNQEFKAKLQDFESQITKKKTSKFNWRIAASIALLMAASWFGYDTFFGNDLQQIYADNYSVYPNTVYTITRGGEDNTTERQAFSTYETKDYKTALENFNKLENKPYLTFYKAQANLQLGNFEEAKKLFTENINAKNDFLAESHWYLALTNLKLDDKSSAKKQLELLIANFDFNKAKAQTLLKALD